ncbi:hypothetical protein HY991_02295 [Candidatus Micrarchaeota archaeon]|nr:hypothetical protein [Candidatus Micrarchaeota archaeon]
MVFVFRGPHTRETIREFLKKVDALTPHKILLELPDDAEVRSALYRASTKGRMEEAEEVLAGGREVFSRYAPILEYGFHKGGVPCVPIDSPSLRGQMLETRIKMALTLKSELDSESKARKLLELLEERSKITTQRNNYMSKRVEDETELSKIIHEEPVVVALIGTDHELSSKKILTPHEELAQPLARDYPINQAEQMLLSRRKKSEIIHFLKRKIESGELKEV